MPLNAEIHAAFGDLGKTIEGLPARYIELAEAAQYAKARAVKWMRLPQILSGIASGGVLNVGENNGIVLGPRTGYAWYLTRLVVDGLFTGSAAATVTGTGTISAGAGSAATPANGQSATGFTLSFSAAPSATGTAVLSNVTGGPYTYNIPSGQTSPYTVNFPFPITASGSGVAPTLTISGLGTGVGTIVLYGQSVAVAADTVSLYRTGQFATQPPLWTFSGAQGQQQLMTGKARITLLYGDSLTLYGTGLTATGVIRLSGELIEMPQERMGDYV